MSKRYCMVRSPCGLGSAFYRLITATRSRRKFDISLNLAESGARVGPGPIVDFRRIYKVLAGIGHARGHGLFTGLDQGALPVTLRHRATQSLGRQMKAAHVVEHHHVEGRGRRALLDETPHMKTFRVRTPVDHLMHRPLVSMKREDHMLAQGKQFG